MKRRTGLLFSCAVVLGLAGGTGSGFLIQRSRPATPLPPIQQSLASAVTPGTADPADAKTDDGAKLDGDLLKVLLDRPAGAHASSGIPAQGWMPIGSLAEYFQKPDTMLVELNTERFRRAARAAWDQADGTEVEVDLVQFRDSDGAGRFFASTNFPINNTTPTVAGTGTGFVGQYKLPNNAGQYEAFGAVRHGNVVELVWMFKTNSAPPQDAVMKVTKDQADRL